MAACEGVIGADFDRNAKTPPTSTDPTLPGAPGSASPSSPNSPDMPTTGDASSPTPTPIPVDVASLCGDMSGLDPKSPWPMAGYCPTRINVSPAPPLVRPRIAWRFKLNETAGYIRSAPVVAADGTVYVVASSTPPSAPTTAWQFYLLGIKDGTETSRVVLTSGDNTSIAGQTPTIARDGDIIVNALNTLYRISPTGVIRWHVPLGKTFGTSPLVLGDGTIVIAAVDGVRGIRGSDGTTAWTYSGTRFEGGVAMTTTGLLVVAQDAPSGVVGGFVHLFEDRGIARWNQKLPDNPSQSPAIDSSNRVFVVSGVQNFMFDASGTISYVTKIPLGDYVEMNAVNLSPAMTPTSIWMHGHHHPVSVETMGGVTKSHEDIGGVSGGFAVASDGSLVVGIRQSLPRDDRIEGLNPDGTRRWKVDIEPPAGDLGAPAIGADGAVYIAVDNIVYAIADAK